MKDDAELAGHDAVDADVAEAKHPDAASAAPSGMASMSSPRSTANRSSSCVLAMAISR